MADARSPIPSPSSPLEIAIGRSLAMCAHPVAAWRLSSVRGRLVVVAGYAAAGYLAVFGALVLMM
jgi:hypothetical protein